MRPLHAVAHGADEIGMANRIDIAGPLQRGFLGVHRVRDVDGEHQFDIDRLGFAPARPVAGNSQLRQSNRPNSNAMIRADASRQMSTAANVPLR